MFERYDRRSRALAKVLLICVVISGLSLLYLFAPVMAQDTDNDPDEKEDEEGGVCCCGLLLILIIILCILGVPFLLILTYLITRTVKHAWRH